MKTAERDMARKLRQEEGLALNEIARRVGASKSSVSLWVRDIVLTPEQHDALQGSNALHYRQQLAAFKRRTTFRQRRIRWQIEGRAATYEGDMLHAIGCMLFWAEGSKKRDSVHVSNADPELLRLFVSFMRARFAVPDDKFRVWCNLFADHEERQAEIEQFWLDTLELPRSSLIKSAVNRYSGHTKKKRTNKLPYGTCRVSVHDVRIAQHLYGAIQEYGRFERPEWLD
jgi:transcriptional regulator with XRE-family HTH domain